MTTQNRITDQGYTGTLVFYKCLKYGFYHAIDITVEEFNEWDGIGVDKVFLGSCEVDVKFDTDTREAEISALEMQRENVRAELGRKVAAIEDRISKLRALTHIEEAAQ